jgi:uncharacterized protein YdaU (DUF1376 family)
MMPWFPRDYLAATRHMSLAERGAYTDLLFFQWEMGPLPNDPVRLARLVGCGAEEFGAVWMEIRDKFEDCLDGTGNLVNRRLEEERQKYAAYRKRQSDGGRKGAEAKWAKARKVVRIGGTGNG